MAASLSASARGSWSPSDTDGQPGDHQTQAAHAVPQCQWPWRPGWGVLAAGHTRALRLPARGAARPGARPAGGEFSDCYWPGPARTKHWQDGLWLGDNPCPVQLDWAAQASRTLPDLQDRDSDSGGQNIKLETWWSRGPAQGPAAPPRPAGRTAPEHLEPPYLEISWYIPGISQGYDHLCRKTGIYQVYTCHMTTIFISQVYTWYIPVPRFFK